MNDVQKQRILAHFSCKIATGQIPVYSHGFEGAGVPTLTTMSILARRLGAEVVHFGYGCFGAKRGYDDVFSFCGGGAMEPIADDEGERVASWSSFSGTDEARVALAVLVPAIQPALDALAKTGGAK